MKYRDAIRWGDLEDVARRNPILRALMPGGFACQWGPRLHTYTPRGEVRRIATRLRALRATCLCQTCLPGWSSRVIEFEGGSR